MVQYTAMSTSARVQVAKSVERDDPAVVARQRHLVQLLVRQHPEFQDVLPTPPWGETSRVDCDR
jgi:hypothetical protein